MILSMPAWTECCVIQWYAMPESVWIIRKAKKNWLKYEQSVLKIFNIHSVGLNISTKFTIPWWTCAYFAGENTPFGIALKCINLSRNGSHFMLNYNAILRGGRRRGEGDIWQTTVMTERVALSVHHFHKRAHFVSGWTLYHSRQRFELKRKTTPPVMIPSTPKNPIKLRSVKWQTDIQMAGL